MKRLILGCSLLVSALVPSGVHAFPTPNFAFVPIDFPGAGATQVRGINNSGQIVGSYGANNNAISGVGDSHDLTENLHGFLFSKGIYSTIDHPGANWTYPQAITDSGKVAGFIGEYDQRGWVTGQLIGYLQDGQNFADFQEEGRNMFVQDASDQGPVVGFAHDGGGTGPGFIYDKGTFTNISKPGTATTYFSGTTEMGTTVGYGAGSFFTVRRGALSPLQVPSGYINFGISDINNLSEFAGTCQDGNGIHGFVMRNGTVTTIDFPGADATEVHGLNDRGDVVGVYYLNGVSRGFVGRRV